MPGYEMMMGGELIPWAWARERLERPRNYWLATVTPKGKPHMMPVWGVWLDERFCFSTGAKSRKARNLEENPNCVIGTEEDNETVVVEATVMRLDPARLDLFLKTASEKYDWPMDPSYEPFFEAVPRVAFGFIESAAGTGYGATRWTFD